MAKKEKKYAATPRKKKVTQPTEDQAVVPKGMDPVTGQVEVLEIATKKVIKVWPVDANELVQQDGYERVE